MNEDLELRQLRYFVVVAEELNFTRAAERLQIAQPPLSRQIQNLEKALEVQLLERTNRRVSLTPAGEVFLTECRQILSQVERGVRAAQRMAQGEAGQLVVGFEGAAHNDLILDIIRQFRTQFPAVELVMQEMPSGKQVEALQQGQLDVGLIEPIAAGAGIETAPLIAEPLVVALPDTHPLAGEAQLSLGQLVDEPWVTGRSKDGCGLLLRILEACHREGFAPKVKQETNDLQMILVFVAAGFGVTMLAESSALAREGIVYRPVEPPAPESPAPMVQLVVAWRAEQRLPVVESFLKIVEGCLGGELVG